MDGYQRERELGVGAIRNLIGGGMVPKFWRKLWCKLDTNKGKKDKLQMFCNTVGQRKSMKI